MGMHDDFKSAAGYFGKKKAGRQPMIEQMEEAAGIAPAAPMAKPGETIKSGEQAAPWTGPRPWEDNKKSTAKPL